VDKKEKGKKLERIETLILAVEADQPKLALDQRTESERSRNCGMPKTRFVATCTCP